jgi:MYXO-CTERM domain-containing protein
VSTAVGNAVINDCQAHGQFTHDWSRADLEKALSMLSAMTNQYSSCPNDIHRALATGIKVHDVTGGSGGGSGTTIVIIVVAVLVVLAALLAGLAIRRRRLEGSGGGGAAA